MYTHPTDPTKKEGENQVLIEPWVEFSRSINKEIGREEINVYYPEPECQKLRTRRCKIVGVESYGCGQPV